ncbi:MAG: RecQ family ATP-dependent DNA helicase [Flavobacteriales bacterium]|nr:RecQ family ATP-dependent DNA helicase [Flavobacteriales bacterium]
MSNKPATVEDVHSVLKRVWGYDRFRPRQESIIRSALSGADTLALLPTGGGKSLCFQVPALAMGQLCLVVSPLIALMKDQVGRLKKLGVPARAIISTMTRTEIDNALESAALGKYAFLYVSPERLASDLFLARLPRLPLGLIAIDEAHCISQWGYDFRPAYLNIAEVRKIRPEVPVLALTASATPEVADDIMDRLAFKERKVIRGSFQRPELALWISKGEDKVGRMLRILDHVRGTAIIYMRERRATMRIAGLLRQHGFSAAAYHAGLDVEERDRIQQAWTDGSLRCVVATNAFGMGIDKADVRVVIHMEPPPDLESYYQEAGRAGRDGEASYAFLLTGPGDADHLRERLAGSYPSLQDVRKVYQAFSDMHAIAIGSGLLESYEVDNRALAARTKLPPVVVAHALKALELDGRLSLSDGVRSPSRVLLIADQQLIYGMRVNNERYGPLLEALLRNYGGLFEEPVLIDELRLAKGLKWQVESVITRLQDLHQQRVLSYKQRNDAPSATLLQPRVDAQRLVLDPAALALRKQRAGSRLDAMLDYVEASKECRSRSLIRYFGEEVDADCGTCDVCRRRRTYAPNASGSDVAEPPGLSPEAANVLRWELDEEDQVR